MRNLLIPLTASTLVACGATSEPPAVTAGPSPEPRPAPGTADLSLYDGRTLTYIVATEPGGNYDAYARLIARYLQKHLPGSRVIVKNVPGAGHIVGANTLYASRPDGLTIGTFNTGLIYGQLLENREMRFDLERMSWIGSAAHEPRVIVLSTASGHGSFAELVASGEVIRFAANGIGSAAYNDTRILAAALDLNVEIIPGFEGGEGEMSMLRGEVSALLGAESTFASFVSNGSGYYALAVSDDLRAHPRVPSAREFVTSAEGERLLGLIEGISQLGRLTAGPPGVPAAMLAALREAYSRALADKELLAEAKQVLLPIDPLVGEAVARAMASALDQTPESVALLRKAIAPPGR
jgi:tripartite-type tricarboxylate transporter receptor subunit TctC